MSRHLVCTVPPGFQRAKNCAVEAARARYEQSMEWKIKAPGSRCVTAHVSRQAIDWWSSASSRAKPKTSKLLAMRSGEADFGIDDFVVDVPGSPPARASPLRLGDLASTGSRRSVDLNGSPRGPYWVGARHEARTHSLIAGARRRQKLQRRGAGRQGEVPVGVGPGADLSTRYRRRLGLSLMTS